MESKVEIFDISISLLPKSRDLFQGDSILRRCSAKLSTVCIKSSKVQFYENDNIKSSFSDFFSPNIVRFLVLVTTMVTKVDHNHRSNDRSNHHGYYDGY